MTDGPLEKLRGSQLPRMVRWYDPRLLARVGVRTIVSSVFGQYADHRLIQAATDCASRDQLLSRYDYSDPFAEDSACCVDADYNANFWIDYIADIGDGFEPTYTTAYLLAQDNLDVGLEKLLLAGSVLIMGGDQCYPQATREDYKQRLQLPYGWAFNVTEPTRKLFAIPGNHDWYDGLSAFDSLFCAARDRLSAGKGHAIGGWQCCQHRSYWALRLPHNWWIWGADIQFSKYLDINQVNYFEAIAQQIGPEDKLIICLAEPAWLLADIEGADEEQNFFKITTIARRRGAKICAVIAGDWHHYARYSSQELGVHFITSGGGGSFLHPTHVLPSELELRWPERLTSDAVAVPYTDGKITEGFEAQSYDLRLKHQNGSGGIAKEVVEDVIATSAEKKQTTRRPRRLLPPKRPAHCYPSRTRSWLLSLWNLAFPFLNFPFAVGIGIIYWMVTWQFHSVARRFDISAGKIDHVGVGVPIDQLLPWMPLYVLQATLSMSFALMLIVLWSALVCYAPRLHTAGLWGNLRRLITGTLHFTAHLVAMFTLFPLLLAFNNMIAPVLSTHIEAFSREAQQKAPVLRSVIEELLEPLSTRRQEQRDGGMQRGERTGDMVSASSPPPPMDPTRRSAPQQSEPNAIRELVGLLYPLQMTLLGAIVGGFIWGLYWVLAGFLGRMHAEDAFGALRIMDYRNFLRMKFEADRVTIYPIGIDRIPRSNDWIAPGVTAPRSRFVPKKPIRCRLIEEPIIICADDLQN